MKLLPHRALDPRTDHLYALGDRERTYGAPFPTGWYRVLETRDLKPGQVRSIDALGRHLVAFRGENGKAAVLDAHCPHQGASLAGGEVCGDTLRCPFHAWAFDGSGKLCDIPGLEKIPRATVRAHPTVEQHGMIWMFHHVSGQPVAPTYAPEPLEPIVSRGMTYRGRYDAGIARMHLTEFIENSVDFQHFAHVHGRLTVPWTTWTVPGLGLFNDPRWYPDPEKKHLAYFEVDSGMVFRGKRLASTKTHVKVTMFGPAGVVWFHFDVPKVGEIVLFQSHLPVSPLEQHVLFHWFAEKKVPGWLAWIVVGQWVSNWKADLKIWENKVFRAKPVLVSIDGPVREMRAWHRQFTDEDEAEPKALGA